MIDFQYIKETSVDEKHISNLLEKIVACEKKNIGEITVIFCSDEYLFKKNIKHLKHYTLTDVITFDYCVGDIISGDIFISIDRLKENARKYNVTFLNEMLRVIIHGLLHLLGYDDKTSEQKTIIRKKEEYYLLK